MQKDANSFFQKLSNDFGDTLHLEQKLRKCHFLKNLTEIFSHKKDKKISQILTNWFLQFLLDKCPFILKLERMGVFAPLGGFSRF